MKEKKRIILGAGVAGIAAAYRLQESGISSVIYESDETYGGLCNSFTIEGFTFDTFAHVSFDNNTVRWLEEQTEHYVHKPMALNFDRGYWLKHPVQNNLFGLPVEERVALLEGFVNREKKNVSLNYGEWLQTTYGQLFAEKYPYKYTRKYWTVEPEQLEVNWIKGRMYEPNLKEVLTGAMQKETPEVHYSKEIRYPVRGGFKSFLSMMAEHCNIECEKKVIAIDPEEKIITFQDETRAVYDELISTIPLPELCEIIHGVPIEVKEASEQLDYTSGVMISLGFNRENISPSLWYYIYDEDILPARIYAPDWKSPNNVPEGCSAIQAEIYFSKYKPMTWSLEEILEQSIEQMLKLGLFQKDDIRVKDVRMKKYANVMFTHNVYKNREIIHTYLDSIGIKYAGRFGEWDYLWVGQSLMSGRKAAERVISL